MSECLKDVSAATAHTTAKNPRGFLERLPKWVIVIPLAAIAVLLLARSASARTITAAALTVVAVGELMWWNTAFRLNAEPRANYAVLEQPVGICDHASRRIRWLA